MKNDVVIKFSAKDDRRLQRWAEEVDLTVGELIHGMIVASLDAIDSLDRSSTFAHAKKIAQRHAARKRNLVKSRATKATRARREARRA